MIQSRRDKILARIEIRKGVMFGPEPKPVVREEIHRVPKLMTWQEFADAMGLPPDHPEVNG